MPRSTESDATLLTDYVWSLQDGRSKTSAESVQAMRTCTNPIVREIVAKDAGLEEPPSAETWRLAVHLFAERVKAARWQGVAA